MSPTRWIIVLICFLAVGSNGFSDRSNWKESLQSGLSQHYLGHLAESEALLRIALDGSRKDGNRADTAGVLSHLGALYLTEDRFAEAEDAYSEALSIYKQVPSPEIGVVVSLRGLGTAYALEGRDKKAVSILNDALRQAKKNFASDDAIIAAILNSLGMAYVQGGQSKKAESLFEEVIRLTTEAGGTAFLTANALHNLAQIHREQHKYEDAERAYWRSIEIMEQMFGSSHPDLAITRASLGLLYMRMERLDEARDQLLASLRITEQTNPVMPGRMVRILHILGEIYVRQQKFIEAEEALANAVDIARKNPEHDPEIVKVLDAYSTVLKRSGKMDQASATHREADRERATLALTAPLHDLR